eukprot:TRINITY_DN8301_c0_g1_i1.p2 TRINITY_DN8301_c0_g1~~TRINITY_DN8301_c0_g1_i1.p2  ORF type:complete len:102 (+),score=58.72 TRINITY_DN8301_c0_g1_i1:13-318(+)
MIRRPPRSTQSRSSAASDVYKRQIQCTLGVGDTLEGRRFLLMTTGSLGTIGLLTLSLPPGLLLCSTTDFHLNLTLVALLLCLLYTSPSPRDRTRYRMPSSA